MEIKIDVRKSLEKNAEFYYEKAKKQKRKLEGARDALLRSEQKLAELRNAEEKEFKGRQEKMEGREKRTAQKWHEKFHWFISSEGFLCVGGRDATSNEILIKKHTENNDIVFHTDMAGSPFFIIKAEGRDPGEPTCEETAQATASYSRAWRLGLGYIEVFMVKPEQVSKTTKSGEYMPKGAFMITGDTHYFKPQLRLAVGATAESGIMAGPVNAIKKNCLKIVEVVQGKKKTSEVAKQIQKKVGGSLDEIIRGLPAGGCEIKK